MSIKIDLEKACGRLKWDFIKDTLIDIGFPHNIIQVIWHCISTPKMRVMWNGEKLEEFITSRGIRQGDLIFRYLFVLCLEQLFHLINIVAENNSRRSVKITIRSPTISHLPFADDLIPFVEANLEQANVIKK